MTKEERSIYNHNYYQQNRERRKAQNRATQKKWAENHKEKVAAYQREYKEKNAERLREYRREYQRARYIPKTEAGKRKRQAELAAVLKAHGYSIMEEE